MLRIFSVVLQIIFPSKFKITVHNCKFLRATENKFLALFFIIRAPYTTTTMTTCCLALSSSTYLLLPSAQSAYKLTCYIIWYIVCNEKLSNWYSVCHRYDDKLGKKGTNESERKMINKYVTAQVYLAENLLKMSKQ